MQCTAYQTATLNEHANTHAHTVQLMAGRGAGAAQPVSGLTEIAARPNIGELRHHKTYS